MRGGKKENETKPFRETNTKLSLSTLIQVYLSSVERSNFSQDLVSPRVRLCWAAANLLLRPFRLVWSSFSRYIRAFQRGEEIDIHENYIKEM